jgi:hypothetical protein
MFGAISIGMYGMERQLARFEQSAIRTARGPDGGTDLVAEMVEQTIAKHAFVASVATVRTADEMLGTLLDVMA